MNKDSRYPKNSPVVAIEFIWHEELGMQKIFMVLNHQGQLVETTDELIEHWWPWFSIKGGGTYCVAQVISIGKAQGELLRAHNGSHATQDLRDKADMYKRIWCEEPESIEKINKTSNRKSRHKPSVVLQ